MSACFDRAASGPGAISPDVGRGRQAPPFCWSASERRKHKEGASRCCAVSSTRAHLIAPSGRSAPLRCRAAIQLSGREGIRLLVWRRTAARSRSDIDQTSREMTVRGRLDRGRTRSDPALLSESSVAISPFYESNDVVDGAYRQNGRAGSLCV